jgi:hypothetical protein
VEYLTEVNLKEVLAQYKSHKIVFGGQITMVDMAGREDGPEGTIWLKVTDKSYNIIDVDMPSEVFARGVPSEGDFLVVYEDDYISWSPCKPFVDGYTRI